MKKHFRYFVLVLIGLLVFSCNPNDDNSSSNASNNDFAENFGNAVSRDFIGQVVNESNQPLQGVSVKIGTSTVQTDVNGVFIINNADVYQRFAYITAKKSGYIDGSRAMVPTSGKNNVKIMLISNTPVQTIQSGVASEVTLPNGTKVNFDGAFQDENGAAYSGSVQVAMYHLEASNENLSSLMPGMLYAEDTNGEEKVLETYGMMNVELKGSGGQKLQIATGHTAQITMAIDNTQLATAPNSIPLWHFDEVNGYWKEQGSAQRVGNNYVGTVSHFSWWNADTLSNPVLLTIRLVDNNGNPLSNVYSLLSVSAQSFNAVGGITDTNGEISGYVPANTPLNLLVLDGCSNYVHNNGIGSFAADTILSPITINYNATQTTSIVGNLLRCDNSPVTNGYVMLKGSDSGTNIYIQNIVPIVNGSFSFDSYFCNPNFWLQGYNFDSGQTTGELNFTHVTPLNNIGNIIACNNIEEYISFQIDGGATVLLNANVKGDYYPNTNRFSLYATNFQRYLEVSGGTIIPGTYSTADNFSLIEDIYPYIFVNQYSPNTVVFNLTNFGVVGDFIDVTFSGTYSDETGNHTINGTAHVIRDN